MEYVRSIFADGDLSNGRLALAVGEGMGPVCVCVCMRAYSVNDLWQLKHRTGQVCVGVCVFVVCMRVLY